MQSYSVNFVNLVRYVFPSKLRKPRMIGWLTTLLKPLQDNQDEFVSWSGGVRYDMAITPQVIYLEKLLNDKFDEVLRRIYIDDAISFESNELRMKLEERRSSELRMKTELEPSKFILRMRSEFQSEYDFIVYKPSSVTNESLMSAYLDRHKAAGKRYKIKDING